MRYVIALLAAFLILGGGSVFAWHTRRSVERECRQVLKDQKEAEKLQANELLKQFKIEMGMVSPQAGAATPEKTLGGREGEKSL